MATTPLSRTRMIAGPLMVAMLTFTAPTAAQAAGTPGIPDRVVATTTEAPTVESTITEGGTRRRDLTVRSLDDISGAIS